MFPAFGYNYAYPQGRPQMSSDHHHHHRHPVSEGLPPQMKMEASNSPFIYETWPHHYGYPVPTQCHSCCNHNPYPNYYPYRPPYPHFSASPHPPQCYGGYPVYPEPYAFHYPPPPHYTMDLPNYEHDKSMPREFHCCGCHPHHKVDMKGDKSVKIEEHEPEAERKEDSLIPVGSNNLRHPFVWIPPEYMKKSQNTVQEPNPRNGWPPLDYESIKRILEGGDGRISQDQQKRRVNPLERQVADHQEGPSVMIPRQGIKRILEGGDVKKSQDHQEEPRVMIPRQDSKNGGQESKALSGWMPLDVDSLKKLLQDGNIRKDHDDQKRNQSHQMPFPMIWLPCDNEQKGQSKTESDASTSSEPHRQDNHTQKSIPTSASGVKEIEGGQTSVERSRKPPKIIPVKQMDEPAIMKTNGELEAKNIEDNKKFTESVTKSKPSSPKKVSKLPPICLRVDPPKKKNGQGKSRSPSPPVDRVQKVDAVKPSPSMSENKSKGVQNEAENKSIEVEKQATLAEDVVEKPKSHDVVEKKLEEDQKPEKKMMSGTEAATVIQAAYRGYEVRRWEPLKKMKQIANIRDEAVGLKRSIESSASTMDLKQKTALGETIMNLLLKLDTIQGLHSSIRDIRKSVAKELVSLQEMLDTIVIKRTPDVSAKTMEKNTKDKSADESAQGSVEMDKNTKDQISSSKELPVEEICTVMVPEQAFPNKELERDTSGKGAMDITEEAAFENPDEKIELEPSPEVVEVHVDSADQTDLDHDLLAELPVAVVEDDSPDIVCSSAENVEQVNLESELAQTVDEGLEPSATETETTICSSAEKSEQVNLESEPAQTVNEDFEPPVTEPENSESQEASKGEISSEQETESIIPQNVNVPVYDGEGDVNPTEIATQELADLPIQTVDEGFEPSETEPKTTILSGAEKSEQVNLESEPAQPVSEDFEPPVTEPEKLESQAPAEQETESIILQNVDVPVYDEEKDVNQTEMVTQESADLPLLSEMDASVHSDDNVKVESDDHTQAAMEIPRENENEALAEQEAESKVVVPVNDEQTETVTHESETAVSVKSDADITVETVEAVKQPSEADDQKEATIENLRENEGDEKEDAKSAEQVDSNPLEVDAKSAEEDARSAIPTTEDIVKEDENERIVMEENERMRKLLEKLIESGKEQQEVICSLNEKLKDLEGKLAKQKAKKKRTARSRKTKVILPRSCRTANGFSKESPMTLV